MALPIHGKPAPIFYASPVARHVVRWSVGGDRAGNLYPVYWVDRQTRQRNLLGWPMGEWRHVGTVAGPFETLDAAVAAAKGEHG